MMTVLKKQSVIAAVGIIIPIVLATPEKSKKCRRLLLSSHQLNDDISQARHCVGDVNFDLTKFDSLTTKLNLIALAIHEKQGAIHARVVLPKIPRLV